MSNIIVRTTPKNRISINTPKQSVIKTVTSSAQTTNLLRNLVDVDGSSLNNNETVVYDEARDKFVVKELPIVNGGTF
jgi:hypothetical protein